MQSLEGGGWGGRPSEDGESAAVSICQGDVRNGTIESLELKSPILVEERSLAAATPEAPENFAAVSALISACAISSRGAGICTGRVASIVRPGVCGTASRAVLPITCSRLPQETEFKSMDASQHLVPADSEVIVRTGGGGGWGDPLDREPELVRADVLEGSCKQRKGAAGVRSRAPAVLS